MTTKEPDFLNYLKTGGDMVLVGNYNIPKVKGVKLKNLSKTNLIGFNYATNPSNMSERSNDMVHFFLPDHLIERVWENLDYYETVLSQYRAIIQPDFSQYVGMPKAMLIWQHYRRMWTAAYYQQKGLTVIPAPCWSDEDSFEYCFDGMPKDSCLCISTVGCIQNPTVRNRFMLGLAVNRAVQEYVQNHLYAGETFGTVESVQIVSPVDKNGYADVKIEARKNVQIPVGRDIETGQMEYDYDVEYQTITAHLKVRR